MISDVFLPTDALIRSTRTHRPMTFPCSWVRVRASGYP